MPALTARRARLARAHHWPVKRAVTGWAGVPRTPPGSVPIDRIARLLCKLTHACVSVNTWGFLLQPSSLSRCGRVPERSMNFASSPYQNDEDPCCSDVTPIPRRGRRAGRNGGAVGYHADLDPDKRRPYNHWCVGQPVDVAGSGQACGNDWWLRSGWAETPLSWVF